MRIRHVLALALLGVAALYALPRARAAWQLHALATTFANYALCMVGPAGPALLRDDPEAFYKLVRRRLVTAPRDDRPFERCASAAAELSDSDAVERAHRAEAARFVEYGADAADRMRAGSRSELRVWALRVTVDRIAHLAEAARPLVSGSYTTLIRASAHAHEATHPAEPPRPAVGKGLPAFRPLYRSIEHTANGYLLALGHGAHLALFRSTDGIVWHPTRARGRVPASAERCPAGHEGASFVLGTSVDRRQHTVLSVSPDESVTVELLGPIHERIVAIACDEQALVAATRRERSRDVVFRRCELGGPCSRMAVPTFSGGVPVRYPLDLARTGGVTVVAAEMHGIVRVTSSRDDGQTWTPWIVAFDVEEQSGQGFPLANRLLTVGHRILLYGGAEKPALTYPLLASDDFGASWFPPGQAVAGHPAQGVPAKLAGARPSRHVALGRVAP